MVRIGTIELPMRWCPPGTFTMGSPATEPGRDKDEDQVKVTLSKGFWMAETETTQELYESVIGTNPAKFSGPTKPVEMVSWDDAMTFCKRLTLQERRMGRLSAAEVYRLPTEAEWEYACRAGTTTATAFGDTLSSTQANFSGTSPYNGAPGGPEINGTSEVSHYPANAWKLRDMHGNVWEWCRDLYSEKLTGGKDPLAGAGSTDNRRVARGGSWFDKGGYCRSAFREWYDPSHPYNYVGFRCVRADEPSGE
jgi:formylglycine-generating enzyme required for sulfatase activity